jgi:transposase
MEGQNGTGATEKAGKKLHTAEFKAKVMREHLEGGVALSDLAEKYQVHINSLYLGKKQLFENVADVFSGKHEKVVREDQEQIERLKAELRKKDSLIAGLVEDNIALKKSGDGER